VETAEARLRYDRGKMSDTKQENLFKATALRSGAATSNEWPLFVSNCSQHHVYSKPAVVSGYSERLPQSYNFDAVSRVMHHRHERSERAGGSF